MGTSRRTSFSLLVGLSAAGCMPHMGGQPNAAQQASAPILAEKGAQQPDTPMVSDPQDDPAQRVLVDSVNDQVTRVSKILAQREQAKQLAADLREQREARALEKSEREARDEAIADGVERANARKQPPGEPLSQRTREEQESDSPAIKNTVKPTEVKTSVATNEPIEGAADAWDQTIRSAAEESENGDFGDAQPARRLVGAPSAETQIERQNPNVGPAAPGSIRGPGIDPLLALQERFTARVNDDPRNLAAQLELQLARLLRNEPVPSMADLSSLNAEDRELIAAVGDALANFRNLVKTDRSPLASEKARPFIEMADRIRARTDLNIQSVNLCTSVKAFGNYEPIEPMQFVVGNPTKSVFYCEVDGFFSQVNEKQLWESKMSLEIRLFNEAGIQLWGIAPETVVDTSRKRRRDFFIAKLIQLPSKLAPGPYMLKATIRDLNANRVAESTLQISVVNR